MWTRDAALVRTARMATHLIRNKSLCVTIGYGPLRPHALVTTRSGPAGSRSRGSTATVRAADAGTAASKAACVPSEASA